jgi:hypothetical protein
MSNEDYRAGVKKGCEQALRAAVEACERTCGKWSPTGEATISGVKIHICPCAEAIKKLEGYKP